MDLEKLIELILQNPDNICIEYSNINGEETLKVNGETLSDLTKEEIEHYKNIIDSIDDCTFEEIVDELKDMIDLSEFSKMLDTYPNCDHNLLKGYINQSYTVIKDKIESRIEQLNEILNQI